MGVWDGRKKIFQWDLGHFRGLGGKGVAGWGGGVAGDDRPKV